MDSTRKALEAAREALAELLWSERYGIGDGLFANGCDHGFKPARACPNVCCEQRRIHVGYDAALSLIKAELGEG